MKPSTWVLVFWSVLIVVLLLVEVAEISHLFTLPLQSWIGDPLAFVFALVFTTIFALIGAVFVGVFVSARLLRGSGFTPFEEEMLRMHADLLKVRQAVEELRARSGSPAKEPERERRP